MRVYKYNARTDELISVEKLTDEVINRIAFLCWGTAANVKAELLGRRTVWTATSYYAASARSVGPDWALW
jgi:hypothetical protein